MYSPDGADQSWSMFPRLADDAVGEDFEDGSNAPCARPFNDGVEKKCAMMIACKFG